MIMNLHTHTWRCNHADGEEREYVENGIRGGLQVLGFSDHTPCVWDEGHESWFRMRPDQMDDYVDTVLALKKEYAEEIEIHLGLEVEYYPQRFGWLLDFLKDYPVEYLLLGQHFIGNEIGQPYMGAGFQEDSFLRTYVEQTIEAMETGRFLYLAHPDLPAYGGSEQYYKEQMRRLCLRAKELEMPVEINLLGLQDHRNYPNPVFWQIAGEVGNTVILGSDAHKACNVVAEDTIALAEKMVEQYGLDLHSGMELLQSGRMLRKTGR